MRTAHPSSQPAPPPAAGTRPYAARLGAVLALTAVLTTAGCAGLARPVPPPPVPPLPAPAPDPDTGTDLEADPEALPPEVEDMVTDVEMAVAVVDDFWATHWADWFTGDYVPPVVAGFYNGTDGPTCAGQPSTPMNAFYCGDGSDVIAWDIELMQFGHAEGDAFVYLVIAHEWAHAVQARLDPELSAASPELQADCIAGATLYGAAADGTLLFEEQDENELTSAMAFLGDATPWTDPTSHGTAMERMEHFIAGRNGSVGACFPE